MIVEAWALLRLYLIVKSIQLVIVYFTPSRFDTSSSIITSLQQQAKVELVEASLYPALTEHLLTNIFEKFITWDSVYFLDLIVSGIRYEHQFVFTPFYWRFIRDIPLNTDNYYTRLVLGLVVNNILHYLSSLVLYQLSYEIFRNNVQSKRRLKKLSYLSSVSFILSPAGIFLTSNYSEVPCCFLSFLAFYLREISLNYGDFTKLNSKTSLKNNLYKLSYLLSGLLVAVNYGVRANSILLGVLYLYDLYNFLLKNGDIKDAFWSFISGFQILVSVIWMNWFNYNHFCPQRGAWCNKKLPSLFSYAQSRYWNNGFLKYWTPNNIPNFLFASPTIVVSLASFRYFLKIQPRRKLVPYIYANALLLVGAIFFWHTQIITRISSFLPLTCWFTAHLLTSNNSEERKVGSWILNYSILWVFIQTALFASFLPPA